MTARESSTSPHILPLDERSLSEPPPSERAPLDADKDLTSVALEGMRDVTPMVIGIVPFALAIGAVVGASSLSFWQGLLSGPAILAGAAQLATVQMLDDGVSAPIVVLSALMINARILLYSASIAPWFEGESLRRRLLLALPVIDQMHFTCVPRFEQRDLDASQRVAYYTGAAAWLVGGFGVTQAIAISTAAQLPAGVGLEMAAPLALVGLLAKSVTNRATLMAAVTAGGVAVFGAGLPFHSATLVAIFAGIAAATVRPNPGQES